jgi:hypothetical protein
MEFERRIIREPKLFFGDNRSTIDPKVGLMNFGPYGSFEDPKKKESTIILGSISTNASLELLKDWLERLSYRIEGQDILDSNVRGIDFPGISGGGPLRFELSMNEECVETISKKELSDALSHATRRKRIAEVFDIYKQKFSDMSGSHPPDVVLLPIDKRIMDKCKDTRYKEDKIVCERRSFDKRKKFVDIPLFDFHHAMKVLAFRHGMVSQLLRPKTLRFAHGLQDAATVGWNFAAATYYKGTGIPWKLVDVDEECCYIGISFYHEIADDEKTMRTSMAHVYLKTGESQIIRGSSFRWKREKGLSPELTKDQATDIAEKVISLYRRQKRRAPRRVVIHKSTPFTKSEKEGFDECTQDIEVVDYVHVMRRSDIRAYPDGHDYPVIRGTMFGSGTRWFLFTTGFIQSLGTYPGAKVPMPLEIDIARLDTTPAQICRDVMALTKLDWNTADFCRREPVTLSVSRKVGSILAEMRNQAIDNPPEGYRYYM